MKKIASCMMAASAALGLIGAAPVTAGKPRADRLVVDHVVIVTRHGVRPPTKQPPIPAGMASQPWPDWQVPPGWLTPHGKDALRRIASVDRETLRGEGLLPRSGCPDQGTVNVVADSDERTIATADVWINTVAPGCGIANHHRPQDEPDPAFSAIENDLAPYDRAAGDAAVRAAAGAGGFAMLDQRYRPLVDRLDQILCGDRPVKGCGIDHDRTTIRARSGKGRPKLDGMLDTASTAAQSLLLEYADGKPMREVGWGRASAKDIAALSAFHALEFRLVARPHPVALANFAGLAPIVAEGLRGKARVTLISGHDTNIANLAGLLGAHFQVPGLAMDDPAPGGAIVLTQLHDRQGRHFVRAAYRSQTLPQIRSAASVGPSDLYRRQLHIKGCPSSASDGPCPTSAFLDLIGASATAKGS